MKVKIEVLIDYDAEHGSFGEPFCAIEDQLMWAMDHLYNCGLLSGDLNVEISRHEVVISEVEE